MNSWGLLVNTLSILFFFSNVLGFATNCTSIRFQINGEVVEDHMGYAVAGVGDVNGDDTPDFIVGAPGAEPGGQDQAGAAYLYSGSDGHLLHLFYGTAGKGPGEVFGDILGAALSGLGDINGDGRSDFIVAAPLTNPEGRIDAGSVFIYSGLDYSLLQRLDGLSGRGPGEFFGDAFGFSVSGLRDVDGDGIPDFIVGAPYANHDSVIDAGSIYIYSGRNRQLLSQVYGLSAGDNFGYAVSSAGDLDKDGKDDFIVGAPHASPNGIPHAGSVYVFSGARDSLLFLFDGAESSDELGASVAGMGDANKDGTADILVGAPADATQGTSRPGKTFVYSGKDGSLLHLISGLTPDGASGRAVTGAGDVNGDGAQDFMVGARFADFGQLTDAGSVGVYSGIDGRLLYELKGSTQNEFLGWAVAGVGDVDKNGRDDFMIGVRNYDPPVDLSDAGTAYLILSGTDTKGDLNLDNNLSAADLVTLLNIVFQNAETSAPFCVGDTNCDAELTPSDVVNLLNAIFSGAPLPCVS